MPKLLGDFLQEQQEPFVLDVYLLERGFCTQRKRRQPIPNCTQIVRAVLGRLVLPKNAGVKKRREVRVDEEELSSASATTLYNSCSESDVEDASACNEHSPVSVLEEAGSEAASPLHKNQYNFKKTQGESSQSISKCQSKQPTYRSSQEFEQGGYYHDQYIINKRALHQTKQLLVDCVREVIDNQRKRDENGKGQQLKKILGAEELWKLVCENVWVWSQESVDGTNIFRLLNYDFMASFKDWDSASAQHKYEISMEIGDAILEDIVNDIVTCY